MKNIILIFKNSVLRNKLMIIIALASTVLMINIFAGMAKDGTPFNVTAIKIGMIDHDGSPLSEDLRKYLTESLGMEIAEENNYDSLADMLIDRNISAIIEVPQGLYENAAAGTVGELVITTLDDYENAAFIEAYLNTYMQSVKAVSDGAAGNEKAFEKMLSSDISVTSVTTVSGDSDVSMKSSALSAYCLAAGFMMMIISGVTIFISNMIIADRNIGTYNRMKCSSLKPLEYVIGVNLFGIICGTVMNLIFTLVVFGMNKYITLPLELALLINELFVLFSIGLSVVLAQCISSQQALFPIAIGYTTFGSMLGGAWFPITEGLGAVSSIAKIFPQYWFMDIVRNMPDNPGYNCIPNICILALAVILVYLISAVLFTRKNN